MWNDKNIRKIIASSASMSEAVIKMGYHSTGGRAFTKLSKYVNDNNISTLHFKAKINPPIKDFSNLKINDIIILSATNKRDKAGAVIWLAKCSCGEKMYIIPTTVINEDKKHCGCKNKNCSSPSLEKRILRSARGRAKFNKIPFNLELSDIIIPEKCPVLGIPLIKSRGRYRANSPSLDKIIPELGYTKGNVCVISWRANSLKNNGSLDELEKIVLYIKNKINNY